MRIMTILGIFSINRVRCKEEKFDMNFGDEHEKDFDSPKFRFEGKINIINYLNRKIPWLLT